MKKTQSICKKFLAVVLTFALTFGTYIIPVSASPINETESKTLENVLDAYESLKLHKKEVTDKIEEINNTLPVSNAKTKAIEEANEYLEEFNESFHNNSLNEAERETLTVKTTAYNVITVTVDFKNVSTLGLNITNEQMKTQIYNDTYNLLKDYDYQLSFVLKYLNQSEEYTEILNAIGDKFEIVSAYIQELDNLNITYDRNLYGTYATQFATLMIADGTEQDIENAKLLSDNFNVYNSSINSILKNGLIQKYNELNTEVNNSTLSGLESIKSQIETSINSLNEINSDLIALSNTYSVLLNEYNVLVENNDKQNPTEEYINSKILEIKNTLNTIIGSNITVDQINTILEITSNTVTPTTLDMETLVSLMDKDLLAEKLISGELNYEILNSFIDLYNNHMDIILSISTLKSDIENTQNIDINKEELNKYLNSQIDNEVFGTNSEYLNYLNSIENISKTEDERLQILNKLDLIDFSLELLKETLVPSDESVTIINDKISELREFYNKSCDNTLTNLTVNGIELDVNESNHKIYVGNDITDLQVLFESSNPNAKVEILNGKNLKVGTNEVIVIITAENGEVRQYTLEVVRAEKDSALISTTNTQETVSSSNEVSISILNNSVNDDTVLEEEKDSETRNTSDSAEKYNEEVEEEKGMSALTVLLIVLGIALVGFGIYKIFGEKEDKKIEKAFEQPKINKTNYKSNNKKKRK